MSTVDPILNNPTLGYRLDPYEPGLIHRAKASQSTIQVASHEHRNLTRLSREAIEDDRVIIKKQITYQPVIAGSYMGVAAGKTTVVSAEKSKPDDENPSMEPESNQENNLSDSISESNKNAYPNAQHELAQLSVEELAQEEQSLRAEIHHLTNELEQLEREEAREPDEDSYVQAGQGKGKLELDLETKKQELRKVALARIAKSQADLLDILNEGVVSSFQVPISMIKAAYHAGSNPLEQNFDLVI
jgi:hypothetical protein